MNLSEETLKKIEEAIAKFPQKRSAALPMLHLVQEEQGYISDEAMHWIAGKLDLEPINILELVTFYPHFRQKPIGRRLIRVRSEERRVGKECRYRWGPGHDEKIKYRIAVIVDEYVHSTV